MKTAKKSTFSLMFYVKKTKLLKNGEAPVCLRITVNRQYAEVMIKRSLPVNLWDQKKECSKGNGHLVDTLTECRCPHCDTALKVETTRKSKFNDYEYLCITTTYGEFQVLRFLYVECWMSVR